MDKFTAIVILGACFMAFALGGYALYLLAHCQL